MLAGIYVSGYITVVGAFNKDFEPLEHLTCQLLRQPHDSKIAKQEKKGIVKLKFIVSV